MVSSFVCHCDKRSMPPKKAKISGESAIENILRFVEADDDFSDDNFDDDENDLDGIYGETGQCCIFVSILCCRM